MCLEATLAVNVIFTRVSATPSSFSPYLPPLSPTHPQDSNQELGGLGEVFSNRDSVHVLCYSIMMLNTDQHNSQVKKKMTFREFIKNQRKTNNGSNFPEQFLNDVYTNIK